MKNRNTVKGLLGGCCVLLVAGCVETQAPSQPKTRKAPEAQATPTIPGRVDQEKSSKGIEYKFKRLPGMDCIVNEYGIRRKVIVSQRNVRCSASPGGSVGGTDLLYFRPYYVFDCSPQTGPVQHLRVGNTPRKDSIKGWIPVSVCTPWDHRVGVRPRRNTNRRLPPLTVYRDKESVIEIARTGRTSGKALARASYEAGTTQSFMPWPIVETARVEVKGGVQEILRLAFLGEFKEGGTLTEEANGSGSAEQYTAKEIKRIKASVKQLDVCFVMDSTSSTQPYIEAMKKTVVGLSQRLHDLEFRPDLALGLVEYRDYVPGLMFKDNGRDSVVRVLPLQDNLQAFINTVAPIREAAESSLDWPESVYDGVLEALTQTPWRGDKLSAKLIVLIGDNSAHLPGTRGNPRKITPEQIVAKARAKGVRVFSLSVKGGGGNGEQRRHWQQFETLAKGTGGQCFAMEAHVIEKLASRIEDILKTETATVATHSVMVEDLSEGKTKQQIMGERNIDIHAWTETMTFLESGGVDVDRLRGGPTFSTGWCLGEFRGIPLITKEVYCARSELDMLLAELNVLSLHLSPEFSKGLAMAGMGGRIHPGSFFARREPGPMDLFLMKQGIPVSNGILKLTRAELEHMPEDRRAKLREDLIRRTIPQILNCRNGDSFVYADDLEFGWVDEAILP